MIIRLSDNDYVLYIYRKIVISRRGYYWFQRPCNAASNKERLLLQISQKLLEIHKKLRENAPIIDNFGHFTSCTSWNGVSAASIWGRLLLLWVYWKVRLLFKGGYYLRAARNNDFTVLDISSKLNLNSWKYLDGVFQVLQNQNILEKSKFLSNLH